MIKGIRGFLSRMRTPQKPSPGQDPFAGVVWVEAAQNPFRVRMVDCRSFSRTHLSTTGNPQIAEKFVSLRQSDGSQHRGKAPTGALRIECNLRYPFDGTAREGRLFGAREMEDKWDIYLYDGFLFFARSWTDMLIYRAKADFSGRDLIVSFVESDYQQNGKAFALREVDFLIKSHLFGREVPNPLPNSLPNNPKDIALFSIGHYGRRASYATFEDTISLVASPRPHKLPVVPR